MRKFKLVIEMKYWYCEKCPLWIVNWGDESFCCGESPPKKIPEKVMDLAIRPDWCPLEEVK